MPHPSTICSGAVSGWQTDVTDEHSVKALADHVYDTLGKCNLVFANAGVTSGGGGKPWQQEPNDWRWCFGVNVFGTAFCVSEFVPRMIETGGDPGWRRRDKARFAGNHGT